MKYALALTLAAAPLFAQTDSPKAVYPVGTIPIMGEFRVMNSKKVLLSCSQRGWDGPVFDCAIAKGASLDAVISALLESAREEGKRYEDEHAARTADLERYLKRLCTLYWTKSCIGYLPMPTEK